MASRRCPLNLIDGLNTEQVNNLFTKTSAKQCGAWLKCWTSSKMLAINCFLHDGEEVDLFKACL